MEPLNGLRVVELGHALAGPLAGTFLGDFGAEIIKVERPPGGDSLRNMGPKKEGVGIWWLVAGRNKKSIAVDLKSAAGIAVLKDLLLKSDVLIENYRPGALEKMGLSWDEVQTLNPRLVMLRISGFGQTGPYRGRGGFGKIGEAFSGATNLTGYPDEPPVHPSYSLGDAVCALAGAFGVTLALLARQTSGVGQLVDLALYEPMFRLIEWQIPMHTMAGVKVARNGPRFPFTEAFITDVCRTADNQNVVVAAATTDSLQRLRALLSEEGLATSGATTDALAEGLRAWIARTPQAEVLTTFEKRNLVAGLVYTPAQMIEDPHFKARDNIVDVPDARFGSIPMPGIVPKLSATPGSVKSAGPALGEHTNEILRDCLGYDAARIEELKRDGVV